MSIYLDNAATTKPCEPAVTAAFSCMVEDYGNPSSLHKLGISAEMQMNNARKSIAAALVCDPSCIYFTSGATESNNLAILGISEAYGKRRKKIVTTSVEHPSVAEPVNYLEKHGFEVVRISPDRNGEFDHEDIVNAVDENTCLVSCMYVNNENGSILPIKRAFMSVKRKYPECVTHCDAVQAFMKIPIKTSELYADIISVSGHKVYALKGTGAVYIKKGIRVSPLMLGGGQEKGIRSGTECVPLISGFGAAVSALLPGIRSSFEKAGELNSYMRKAFSELKGVKINSGEDNTSPYILNISVEGIRSEIMLHFLESREIYVSSGSACSKGAKSSVLKEFGISDKDADSALRISISRSTSKEEIDALVTAVAEGQNKLSR